MLSTTLRFIISFTAVFVGFLIQMPQSLADETLGLKGQAAITQDVHATHEAEGSAETIMIQTMSDEDTRAPSERKIKVIRAGSANALDSNAIRRLLQDELRDKNLPPEVMAALNEALNEDSALSDMNVDVIVNDSGGHHVVLRDFNPSEPGMDPRMRPNPGLRWREKAPPEPTQLSEKAAECILKSLTKVTTESGTRLLREACQAAYPDK